MKFPRNARLLRNQLDATPFAGVFFLLVIFLMLGALMPVPGIRLPLADDLSGPDKQVVTVAMDAGGQLYYGNRPVNETELKLRLRAAAANAAEPLALVVQADEAVAWKNLERLTLLARDAGIYEVYSATSPRAFATPDHALPARSAPTHP